MAVAAEVTDWIKVLPCGELWVLGGAGAGFIERGQMRCRSAAVSKDESRQQAYSRMPNCRLPNKDTPTALIRKAELGMLQ